MNITKDYLNHLEERTELTNEEFAIFLQHIVKRSGDSVKELREKTENLSLDEFIKMIKKYQQ